MRFGHIQNHGIIKAIRDGAQPDTLSSSKTDSRLPALGSDVHYGKR
jgi:hypothetical protein